MQEYVCTEVIDLHTGMVGLTKKQAGRRPTQLSPVKGKKDVYEIQAPVYFKSGEVIRLADPDKATQAKLELTEAALARADAKAEAEEKARAKARQAAVDELAKLQGIEKPTEKDIDRITELETILIEE